MRFANFIAIIFHTSVPFYFTFQTGYRKPGICPSCNGLVPPPSTTNHHLIPVDPILSAAGIGGPADATTLGLPHHHHHTATAHQYHHNITSASNVNANKSDNAFWNFSKFQHPLQRDHSFHSVGKSVSSQVKIHITHRIIINIIITPLNLCESNMLCKTPEIP